MAVGTEVVDGNEQGAVWFSEDGSEWTRVSDPDGVFSAPLPVRLNRVFSPSKAGNGFPSLVVDGSAGGEAAVWTSDDGAEWARDADSPGALGRQGGITSFRAGPGFVIAVGSSGAEGNLDALVLTGGPR